MKRGWMRCAPIVIAVSCVVSDALASAPDTSLRPQPRPVEVVINRSAGIAPHVSLRPRARPTRQNDGKRHVQADAAMIEQTIVEYIIVREAAETRVITVASQTPALVVSPYAVGRSLFPKKRPRGSQVASVKPTQPIKTKSKRYKKKGSVCGKRGIRGYPVSRVRGKIGGCGIANPVKVTEIDGVKLTREVLIGCDAARSLYSWVHRSAKRTVGRKGGGLAKIQTIAGYSCRTRNSRRGARLSEHAKGKAVDIAGFVLKDGTTLSVDKDWRQGSKGRVLKKLHKSACGPFGTVLGPNADRHHRDHFHFDVARHRGGAYCR